MLDDDSAKSGMVRRAKKKWLKMKKKTMAPGRQVKYPRHVFAVPLLPAVSHPAVLRLYSRGHSTLFPLLSLLLL